MKRTRKNAAGAVEMQMGPMIDMVFLLLVFFMVSAKPQKPEADINLGLPGAAEQNEALQLPDEQRVLIQNSGAVVLNELTVAASDDRRMETLFSTLFRLKQAAIAAQGEVLVTLCAEDAATHQRIVDVLNVCAKAGISSVTFDDPAEGQE